MEIAVSELMNWDALFGIHTPILEIVVRGSAIYWFLFLLFRFVMHRDVGAVGIADILLLVLIADASQNAMAGDYKSITEGLLLVSTIVSWNLLLDRLAYHLPAVARFAEPPSLPLVRNGRIIQKSLEREMLTRDELMSKLRQKGIENLSDVKVARLEPDGEISVIQRKGNKKPDADNSRRTPVKN